MSALNHTGIECLMIDGLRAFATGAFDGASLDPSCSCSRTDLRFALISSQDRRLRHKEEDINSLADEEMSKQELSECDSDSWGNRKKVIISQRHVRVPIDRARYC